jgi:Beta-lactamase superfamily domain/DNA repair metallo-beta-lactamase
MRLEELPFEVDIFVERPGRTSPPSAFFLSHAHTDHLSGLSAQPMEAHTADLLIYCTAATAALAVQRTGAQPERFRHLTLGRPTVIPECLPRVTATALPANHCLGACMLLFDIEPVEPDSSAPPVRILHTGDFRYSRDSPLPAVSDFYADTVDVLYLDVTYGHPSFTFPMQHAAVSSVIRVARDAWRESADIFIGGDTLGKEELYAAIGASLQTRILVDHPRYDTIEAANPALATASFARPPLTMSAHGNLLATGPQEPSATSAQAIHIVPWWAITPGTIAAWTAKTGRPARVLLPTACPARIAPGTPGIPLLFSSHSSFNELRAFVAAIRPRRVAATPETAHYTAKDGLMRDPAIHFHDLVNDTPRHTAFGVGPARRDAVHNGISLHLLALMHRNQQMMQLHALSADVEVLYSSTEDNGDSDNGFCSVPFRIPIVKKKRKQMSARLAELIRPALDLRPHKILQKRRRNPIRRTKQKLLEGFARLSSPLPKFPVEELQSQEMPSPAQRQTIELQGQNKPDESSSMTKRAVSAIANSIVASQSKTSCLVDMTGNPVQRQVSGASVWF